jgi:hypothetical protein
MEMGSEIQHAFNTPYAKMTRILRSFSYKFHFLGKFYYFQYLLPYWWKILGLATSIAFFMKDFANGLTFKILCPLLGCHFLKLFWIMWIHRCSDRDKIPAPCMLRRGELRLTPWHKSKVAHCIWQGTDKQSCHFLRLWHSDSHHSSRA